jgi:tetratricopeptide (TPR) repeat protein
MTEQHRIGWTQWLVALAGIVALCSPSVARGSAGPQTAATMAALVAATSNQQIATLEAARGRVTIIRLGRTELPSLSMPLQLDDVIVTRQGRATVRFHSDGMVLRIGPDSRVQINESAKERDIKVFFGRLWAHVVRFKEQTTRFATSSTIAAVRGTEVSFGVAVDGDETQLAVLEGQVEAKTDAGSLTLKNGESAVARKGKAPAFSVRVRPQDAVQWALYYLPVLYTKPGELGTGQEWQGKVRESTEAYLKGDLGTALDSLENLDVKDIRDPRFFTYRASLLLATGSVEKAGQDIEMALSLAPNNSEALALQAIVAVAKNQTDRALTIADRAARADPRSATAEVARSYARQAKFDLEGARESLENAVRLAPNDALAWARLAEIRSSLGYLDEALAAAQKAVELEPNLSRTQTVLGFAYLTRVQTREAREAFQKAIGLDQDDPLPRLGLGLARIRDGELGEGSREIEVAVSLDPGQALVRSYLGKAYFEAKRTGLDEREYDVAKGLDPNDPTPWLYDAIAKQTTNRPVEALDSVEKSIDLNDNRAVYRSRLLLDSDLAARSASLGRIYSDLGFQNLALVEGWKSVNTDPGNFSAHRLLADSYAVLPRHEIARVSELFQSQMLQPLNFTPIQPQLAESNLLLIASQGPGVLAFNEFNPLFNRDQANVQGNFMGGSSSTAAGDVIISGITGKFSYSVGYSGFKTDGFRENNSQDDKIADGFLQAALSPGTSLQAEVRYRELKTGDLGLHFFEDDYSRFQTETDTVTNARVGLRQDLGPSAVLLASYMYADKEIDFALPDPDLGQSFTVGRKERSDSLEAQVQARGSALKLVAGGGYFDIDSNETDTFAFEDPVFGFTDITTGDSTTKHTNLYAYLYWSLRTNLTLTLGASGDLFKEDGEFFSDFQIPEVPPGEPVPIEPPPVLGTKDQFNPKVGLTWSLGSGTTLRAAWFKALKRTLITDQTLEPTQVAGFNQFYDDPTATASDVWGAAIDQKFGSRVFGGLEYTARDLTIPHLLLENGVEWTVTDKPGNESVARAYLFAAAARWLTIAAEYQYENIERDPELFLSFSKAKTERVPLSVRFFLPSGFGALVGATYLKQEGEFRPATGFDFLPGERSFWVFDAALRYVLPKRYGHIVAGVNNLTDEKSTYEATDSRNLGIRPGRFVYARVVLAFP